VSVKINGGIANTTPALHSQTDAVEELVPNRKDWTTMDEALWESLSSHEYTVVDNPTDPHLEQYLAIIKALINRALERHRAKSAPYWSPKGTFRQMVYVNQVNHALDQLVADIRDGHPATRLAQRMDAIRGLIVDLWM
jgi:hypothetical protein